MKLSKCGGGSGSGSGSGGARQIRENLIGCGWYHNNRASTQASTLLILPFFRPASLFEQKTTYHGCPTINERHLRSSSLFLRNALQRLITVWPISRVNLLETIAYHQRMSHLTCCLRDSYLHWTGIINRRFIIQCSGLINLDIC